MKKLSARWQSILLFLVLTLSGAGMQYILYIVECRVILQKTIISKTSVFTLLANSILIGSVTLIKRIPHNGPFRKSPAPGFKVTDLFEQQ